MIMEDGFEFLDIFGDIDEEYINQALQPWKKNTSFFSFYHFGKKVACIVVIIILSFCCIFHKQVEAAAKRFITYIADVLNIQEDLTSYAEIIGTSIEQEGITVCLKEAIVSANTIGIAVDVENLPKEYGVGNGEIIINQVHQIPDMVSGGYKPENTIYVEKYDFNNEIPYQENNEISVGINIYPNDAINAVPLSFIFSFNISKEDICEEMISQKLNETIKIDEKTYIKLVSYTNNIFNSNIEIETNQDTETLFKNDLQYYIWADDNLGNRMLYFVSQKNQQAITFQCENYIPSDVKWLDIQLFSYEPTYCNLDNDIGNEYGEQESAVFEINSARMIPMGDNVRINLSE